MEKGFLASLFDMSFSEFVTIRLIKVLYIIGIIGAVLAGLLFIVSGFSNGAGTGILFLLLSPILVGIYILMVRIWLELIIVVFRIAENTSLLVKIKKEGVAAAGEE
jgi:drug/metabolite transporter (DMT)-like permease